MSRSLIIFFFRPISFIVGFILLFIWVFDARRKEIIKTEPHNILINDLEVAAVDEGFDNYLEITEAVEKLGNGWRIPTIDDYKIMKDNQYLIKNLNTSIAYLSSDNNPKDSLEKKLFSFGKDYKNWHTKELKKPRFRIWGIDRYYIRFVRTIKK